MAAKPRLLDLFCCEGGAARGYRFHRPQAEAAMGIDWMTGEGRSQAIPPAYTRFLGEYLMAEVLCAKR